MNSKHLLSLLSAILLLTGCGSAALVSTPIENIDPLPLKVSALTETEKKTWSHADLVTDTIPGMSIDRAYRELLKHKKGVPVIVAVLDAGIDLKHEDLDEVLWTNQGEVPDNNKDDDGNGYMDDIHGYNFLGASYKEQLEYTRMLRLHLGDSIQRTKAEQTWKEAYAKAQQNQQQYQQILHIVQNAHQAVTKALGKTSYTREALQAIEPTTIAMRQNIALLTQMLAYQESIPQVIDELNEALTYFSDQVNYHLNREFNGRTPVGDDPYDITDTSYGNGNPQNQVPSESHGTHVAGIIAAERNNKKGINGIANHVKLMSIRVVPDGDEYDKDVALGIRYAVDNGAKIINCSFGKSFSPKATWVYEAIAYAAANDVLLVHAAGNDGKNLDDSNNPNFPDDHKPGNTEFVDNMITVAALTSDYGAALVAPFSNYGQTHVDLYAPGDAIYSTMPGDAYDFQGGTSMAAPAVSGIAALLRSYYPQLSAVQVKHILMQSGIPLKIDVHVGSNPSKTIPFDKLSKSGKIVNAYNALILAETIAKGKTALELNHQ